MDISTVQTMSPGIASAKNEITQLRRIAEKSREGTPEQQKAAFDESCRKFESIFIRMLLQQMRKSVPKSGIFGEKNHALSLYEEMADEALADELGKSGSLGIAKILETELKKPVVQDLGDENRANNSQATSTREFLSLRGRSLEYGAGQ